MQGFLIPEEHPPILVETVLSLIVDVKTVISQGGGPERDRLQSRGELAGGGPQVEELKKGASFLLGMDWLCI